MIVSAIVISLIIGIIVGFTMQTSPDENTVVVGAQNFTEQYILGEMLALLIEEYTDLNVEKKFGYSIEDVHQPFMEGEIDMYPEYTGTAWGGILEEPLIYQPDILYQEVKKVYEEDFNALWLDRYGFNNTYGLGMKEAQATEEGIYTYSDLALKSRPLTLGAERSFYLLQDAYPGLVEKYGFQFKDEKVLDIDKKYEALETGEVDVIDVFSTDGDLEQYNILLLIDDQNYFPPYEAATVIRMDILEEHPELEEILNKLGGQINNEEMAHLNYLVENSGMSPEEVARLYLTSKNLIS
ncbi:glycine betaine ABC transporter substrate-binding protein [Vallitalea okinawensis]|uniref:glycine betaine ABC transporter substrate-binding protein n=1 Tax=Vallitalea okinawensis TaxID=2078660 RepID=UPI001FA8C926|nr:glycine betaine ABC transporter substrate-binding protein [Vallitalea okinawensis]